MQSRVQKFSKLFAALAASLLGSILPRKADAIYHSEGSGGWPGFVRPSTMRKFHRGIGGAVPSNDAKECARRVAKGQAPWEYNKEAELAVASYARGSDYVHWMGFDPGADDRTGHMIVEK